MPDGAAWNSCRPAIRLVAQWRAAALSYDGYTGSALATIGSRLSSSDGDRIATSLLLFSRFSAALCTIAGQEDGLRMVERVEINLSRFLMLYDDISYSKKE